MSIPISKILSMLTFYRERLEKVNTPPIDYLEGIRTDAIIGLLEQLYYIALREET